MKRCLLALQPQRCSTALLASNKTSEHSPDQRTSSAGQRRFGVEGVRVEVVTWRGGELLISPSLLLSLMWTVSASSDAGYDSVVATLPEPRMPLIIAEIKELRQGALGSRLA